MREIYVNPDYTRVGFYKSALDEAGIPNHIRNAVSNGITEIPIPLFYPTLCVMNDEDYPRAMEILGKIHYARRTRLPDWHCPKCQASVPGNFELCWRCEEVRIDVEN